MLGKSIDIKINCRIRELGRPTSVSVVTISLMGGTNKRFYNFSKVVNRGSLR